MNRRRILILLPWLCIFLSAQALLSSLAIEERISSKHLLIQQEVAGHSNSTTSFPHGDGKGRKNEMGDSVKAQKGKGSYGGANVVHHPRPKNRAESLAKTPYYIYISTAITLCISSSLLLVPSF